MATESATYIDGLDSAKPANTETPAEGDDHLKLIKAVLKATLAGPAGAGLTGAVTASHTELNILDGATLSTAELNVLDGIPATLTATELGYVDGVTSAIQTQLNAKSPAASPTFTGTITTPLTASRALATGASSELAASATTAAELALLNTAAAGTITNSKAVIYGASGEVNATTLQIGGVSLTPTATEFNYVAGVTSAIQDQFTGKQPVHVFAAGGAATLNAARFQVYVATSSATVNLPASPTLGDVVIILATAASTSAGRSSKNINGAASDRVITGGAETYGGAIFVYSSTGNWTSAWFLPVT